MAEHTVKINGTEYLVKYTTKVPGKEWGSCTHPHEPDPTILINSRKRGADLLYAISHEMLHGAAWELSEETVTAYSAALSKYIFRPEVLERLQLRRTLKRPKNDDPHQ